MHDVETLFSSIELAPIARGIAGLSSGEPYVMSVESPVAGVAARSAVLRIKGWIYSRGPALAGLVIKGPVREWATPVDKPRPDVVEIAKQKVPDLDFPERC